VADCTYAGISFDVQAEGNTRPEWHVREYTIYRTKIPYSNKEEIQDGGRSGEVLEFTAVFYSTADWVTFRAAQSPVTKRTLHIYGRDDANVKLASLAKARRHAWHDRWYVSVTFERASA
jgi:hypothetical protein